METVAFPNDATRQQGLPGAQFDAPLFERSASLERLDSFAYFSHQGEKQGLASEAKACKEVICFTNSDEITSLIEIAK